MGVGCRTQGGGARYCSTANIVQGNIRADNQDAPRSEERIKRVGISKYEGRQESRIHRSRTEE